MKRKIFNFLIMLICVPAIILCGCSKKKSNLPKIDASEYFENSVSALTYNSTNAKTLKFETLTAKNVNPLDVDNFTEIKITAKSALVYKMYIDCIYFYVYANNTTNTEMVINVSITNLVSEDEISNENSIKTIEETCSFIPKKNGSVLCKVDIQKTIATATGCTITFDIYNSTNGTVADDNGNSTNFKWTIYDLSFYAEHRTY